MQPSYIDLLFKKLLNNECSPEELDEIIGWLNAPGNEDEASALIREKLAAAPDDKQLPEKVKQDLQRRLQNILSNDVAPVIPITRQHGNYKWWWAAAAVLVITTGSVTYFLRQPKQISQQPIATASVPNDLPPGKEGAVLTLADGSQVVLDSVGNGIIANQNSVQVNIKDGHLVYNKNNQAPATTAIAYNTMATPKGRQCQLVLSDGTRVWMNAFSTLTFPVAFNGAERRVKVSGELYFEVAKNPSMPFVVELPEHPTYQTKVLGTHFNIMAYPDDDEIKTTLLEGAVVVSKENASVKLKPGEQANIHSANERSFRVENVETGDVVAWKDGFIQFDNLDLPAIMRQLARWYDIEVKYEGETGKRRFGGLINRNIKLTQMLAILQANGVHAKLMGRTVTVNESSK